MSTTRSQLRELRATKLEEQRRFVPSALSEQTPSARDSRKELSPLSAVRLFDFQDINLYGRTNELRDLTDALDRTMLEKAPSEVIFLIGGAGVGKTSLVNHALANYKDRAFCADGKFDQKFDQNDTTVRRPYTAFIQVFANLIQQLIDHPNKTGYAERIQGALGAESSRIIGLIPNLVDLIGEPEDEDDEHDESTFRDGASANQMFRLAREIIRQICSPSRPVVLFLDDLQWSGKESLSLFQALANDTRLTNLLLIGTYRDEEIAPLSMMLEDLRDLQSSLIRIAALHDEAVDEMVADVIGMDVNAIKKFSAVVYRKTGGNPLFIRHFLDRMQELGYLQYTHSIERWGWDLPKIQSETNANDELHEILRYRVQFLPATAHTILTRAACMGSKFDIETLGRVVVWDKTVDLDVDLVDDQKNSNLSKMYMLALEGVSGKATLTKDVSIICQVLCKLGFLRSLGGTMYRFAHDVVHNVAIDQVPPGILRNHVHWTAGQVLRQVLDERDSDRGDDLFFAMVEQFNHGSTNIPDDEERLELAALNLRASYKVKQISAFFPAAAYAKEGLFLLAKVDHKWDFYQGLVTKLILIMAEMAMCCGQSKDCMAATQEIIHQSRTLEEKVPAYLLRIMNLGQRSNFKEAVKEGLEVLRLLGEHFPSEANPTSLALEVAKSKAASFGKTDENMSDLNLMKDSKHKTTMKILATTAFYAVRGDEKVQQFAPLLFCRMFQMTMRHGLCNESIVAYAGYGVVAATVIGDFDEGFRYGRLAMKLQTGLGFYLLARGSFMNFAYLHHLKFPVVETLEPLMESFKAGMICDETADAVDALSVYCSHYLNVGLPLEPLSEEIKSYLSLMLELERERVWQVTVPYAQLTANLMGKNSQPSVLSGDVMHLKVLMDKVKTSNNGNALRAIYAARLEAAYWFASYDMALRMIQHLKSLKLGIGQSLTVAYRREIFFTGLTYLALAKNTKNNRQHIWNARECIGLMKKWTTRGSQDCEDLLLILQAELIAVVGRKTPEEIAQAYQFAVSNAAHVGSLQNTALAAELAGAYHVAQGDYIVAQIFLEQSHTAYNEWNAYKKANHLEVLYPQMFTKLTVASTKKTRF
jgi:predicted ATPase